MLLRHCCYSVPWACHPSPEKDVDDNEVLMPIGVNPMTDDNIGVDTNAVSPTVSTNPPKAGTVLGVAVKSDTGRDPSGTQDQEPKQTNTDDQNKESQLKPTVAEDDQNKSVKNNKKKENICHPTVRTEKKEQTLRKFKCEKCAQELETVHDYNQHYLDNHPPTPCPYCPQLFTSARTMAKHRYRYAETMYECDTCGQGFTFPSQYLSHRKVHLMIQGFVCFKAKCGQCFKRESELNAHLKMHDSKPIKCEHCDYTNKGQHNVQAHMRIHSEKLPPVLLYFVW